MPQLHQQLSETHLIGGRTRQVVVRASLADGRPWLAKTPVCAELAQHQVAHTGICHALAPYRIVRTRLSGTYFLACVGGAGRVLVDGRWQSCRAGMACLLPPHALNAFHAQPGAAWDFCWVRYEQPTDMKPIATSASPVLARYDAEPLRAAIGGLHHECQLAALPAAMHHWAELIQLHVLRFAQPRREDDRLWRLWEKVATSLSEPWALERLATEAHVSGEHLRRLCHHELGRSPVHHLAYLRMRRAAELLATTGLKIETIANEVGYANSFAFSNAFKESTGWRPSEYPGRKARG